MKRFFLIIFLLVNVQIMTAQTIDNPVAEILFSNPKLFSPIIDRRSPNEVQIIYTQINRDKDNHPHFKTWTYGRKPDRYFYPASTVKMPAAFMALEKINKLNIIGLDKNSRMITGKGHAPQTKVEADSSAADNNPSIAHYIKKLFVTSDNDAYNRVYEFLGQEYLNESLVEKGFDNSRILTRVGISGFNRETNRYTNPVSFYDGDKLLYHQAEVYSNYNFGKSLTGLQKGVAYKTWEGPEPRIVNKPFSFAEKNFFCLQDMHDILQAVIFPEATGNKFELTADDYEFLYKWMSARPRECEHPQYDKGDSYVKFFIYGAETDTLPDAIRIFNKVGWSYGYLTDASYIVDFENNVEFFVAAVIHVNENQTYNDDQYEYDETGLPFFKNFGKLLYEYELKRKREFEPDLSKFKVW